MNTRHKKRHWKLVGSLALGALALGGYSMYTLFASQGQLGALSQVPMNAYATVKPAFIMAMDDSGSMTFHNMFPPPATAAGSETWADGYACWDKTRRTFFNTDGSLINFESNDNISCWYAYSYTGPRVNHFFHGIPPVDAYGFARSPDFNPSYFDPSVEYRPWRKADGSEYPDAGLASTRIHPDATASIPLFGTYAGTVTGNGYENSLNSEFLAYQGMTLPKGTRVRRVNSDGTACRTRRLGVGTPDWSIPTGSWTTLSEPRLIHDNGVHFGADVRRERGCRLFIAYHPATFFLRGDNNGPFNPPSMVVDGVDLYTNIKPTKVILPEGGDDACGPGCKLWKYEIGSNAPAAVRQNFANWFSFYGNRHRSMVAGVTQALADTEGMRVGYFLINSVLNDHSGDGDVGAYDSVANNVVMRDMSIASDRTALYADITRVPSGTAKQGGFIGPTPNLHAVLHIGKQFERRDAGAPILQACQRNVGMLFTDGFSSHSFPSNGIPTEAARTPQTGGGTAPFGVSPRGSMAAIASYFYRTNLRTDLLPAGQVPVPDACHTLSKDSVEWKRLDCNQNPHMNFYGITLGGIGDVYDPDNPRDPYLTNPAWPAAFIKRSRSTVDDLWQATVNTRGELLYAKYPADIVAAMRRVLTVVGAGASPSGSAALSGARIGPDSLGVTPFYEVADQGMDWWGDLVASRIRLNASTRLPETVEAWRASERLPAHADRNIWFSQTGGDTVREFKTPAVTYANLCAGLSSTVCSQTSFNSRLGGSSNASIANAVAYLRGDTSKEQGKGGRFRARTSPLGDIVHSTPVISSPGDDFGYGALPGELGSSYRTFLENTKRQQRYMVYAGANDGMLHAFDGGLTYATARNGSAPDANGGKEVFAYIPSTSLRRMGNLLHPDDNFRHLYYVDGPLALSDARIGSSWKTVLVGSGGAGGRSVFALDVSNPGSFGANSRLWEISPHNTSLTNAERNDIGHVLGKPVIVPVKRADGSVTWMAIFGNGYESAVNGNRGRAVLFLVEMGTGAITRVVARESNDGTGMKNGLGNVVVLDRWGGDNLDRAQGDGFADTVYAGDQMGRLWKFDLRNLSWGSENTVATPLFRTQATNGSYRQPILGGLDASPGPGGGMLIYFGTGSFSFENDGADKSMQSLYAVNDTERGPTTRTVGLGSLTKYNVTILPGRPGNRGVNQDGNSGQSGWYVNLPPGERFVGNPSIEAGMVFMPTYTPDPMTSECMPGGANALFGLDALRGGGAFSGLGFGAPGEGATPQGTASVELATGSTMPVRDISIMSIPGREPPSNAEDGTGPGGQPLDPDDLDDMLQQVCLLSLESEGAEAMYMPYNCGRQSWRQIQ